VLRPARKEDAQAVAEIFLAARDEAMPYLPTLHSDDEVRGWIERVLVPGDEVWVAEEDGRVLGFAALHDSLLAHLYVDPSAQGAGIGGALLAKAMELRADGFQLWVFQRNEPARRFYERRGLRLVQLTDGSRNEEHEPDVLYEWRP
jgi:GNAT superfamily N-acetyltransferase